MGSAGLRSLVTVTLATILLIVGCASGPRVRYRHEHVLAPGQGHHAGLTTALLIPINYLNEDPIKEFVAAGPTISGLIVSHLESRGLKVEQADPRQFRPIADAAHRSSIAKRKSGTSDVVSAEVDFGDTIPAILAQLKQSPDLVIATNLVMRTAEVQGTRTFVWDGVRRRETRGGEGDWNGTFPVASIQVIVYSKDGTRVFSGFGGLDLVFELNQVRKEMEPRADLLQDERNLREGICIAFYPYFGLEDSCTR